VRVDSIDRMKAAVFLRWWSLERRRAVSEDALAERFAGGASMRAVWKGFSEQYPVRGLIARMLGWFRQST